MTDSLAEHSGTDKDKTKQHFAAFAKAFEQNQRKIAKEEVIEEEVTVEEEIKLPYYKRLKTHKLVNNTYDLVIQIEFEDHGRGIEFSDAERNSPRVFDIYSYSTEDTSSVTT